MAGIFKKMLIAALLVYLPGQTMAWGMLGHRIVGQIADSYLNKKVKKEIRKILGNESIAMASNWPDFVKSDPSYKYLDNWHYVDFERGTSFAQMKSILEKDTSANAYTKLNFLIAELKKGSLSQEKNAMYLKLVIHIVGDLHQPYHVGYHDDRGGNDIKVTWFGSPTNMHTVWDSKIIEYQQLSYTEYAESINFTNPQQRKQIIEGGLVAWLWDSYQITETLYKDVKAGDKLFYRYNFDHVGTLNSQLLKGGVRLAEVLNEIFG
ncbi:S1/P1 nuclease [Desertivirga xinjiangensis]|uniref:S1/P1 nuclease n=1 Tax=Desertivirga xinjiangensis TaxID=539206 RepID=UPI00210E9B70|nr:S1/P1 nuclease [Pedobacter xinjiangensis]